MEYEGVDFTINLPFCCNQLFVCLNVLFNEIILTYEEIKRIELNYQLYLVSPLHSSYHLPPSPSLPACMHACPPHLMHTISLSLSQMGQTPLNLAVNGSRTEVVQILLDAGAEPDHVDPKVSYTLSLCACLFVHVCV